MKKMKTKVICGVLAMLLAAGPAMTAAAYGETGNDSQNSGIAYAGEQNVLKRAEYGEIGMILNSPEEFDQGDTSHPLQGYEPLKISELYVGEMNRTTKYKGAFRVLNDTETLSKEALNLDNMKKSLVGKEVSFNSFYAANKDPIEVQTNNTCAIDYDGDGTDEILNMTLYVHRDKDDCSFMDLRVFDLSNGTWTEGETLTYRLSKKSNDCEDFVWDIPADTSKSYTSMTAGDFDHDGQEEAAVYVASKEKGNAYISILEVDGSKKLTTKGTIDVSQLNNGSSNKFNMDYNDWYLPIVSLSTTQISGQDDLVVNISNPRNGDSDDIGHTSAMGIYHWDNGKMTARYEDKNMVYGGNRIRFAAATDGDINGNGVEELLIGGNINNDWDDNEDAGSISKTRNYLQVITWNEGTQKYEKVWDEPKNVEGHGSLKVSDAMNEPVAIAAAKVKTGSQSDFVFLEGMLFGFSGGDAEGASEKALLEDGEFYKGMDAIGLGGTNSAFISTAQAGTFSVANGAAEQIVILAGDHRSSNNDNMYYDVIWIWENQDEIQSQVTHNDYFDLRNEDDEGTFMSICAMDVDQDSVYVEYVGKEYGWTSPELFSVLQSAPYWEELDYDGGPGTTTFSVSFGQGTGLEEDWGVQGGISLNATLMAGTGCVGNEILNGMAVGLQLLAGYVGEKNTEITRTDSWACTVPAGEDYAVVYAVPVVDYQYRLWVPETKVTQEYIDQYTSLYGVDCPYNVGDIIGGEVQDCSVTQKFDPAFSAITLDEYNAFVSSHTETGLETITEDELEKKTIGDPTTYPQSKDEILSQADEVKDSFHQGKFAANVTDGTGSTTVGYEITDAETKGHGFHLDVDFHIGWAGEVEASFLFAAKSSWTIEGVLSGSGGAVWTESKTKGLDITTEYTDLPVGTDSLYHYSATQGVYQLEVPSGIDEEELENYDHPYVLSHIVTGISAETAAPKLPKDMIAFDTTADAILLTWKDAAYRPAESYNIYIKDNLGNAKLLGKTEKNYYWVSGLDENTTYSLAIQSVAGDRESVISRWLKATTEAADAVQMEMPYFVTEPESVHYSTGEADEKTEGITLHAEATSNVNGVKITYQWQKLVEDKTTGTSSWQDIPGETGSSYCISDVPSEIGQYYYRVVATQKKDSNYKSIVSRTAVIWVTEKYTDVKKHETTSNFDMEVEGGALQLRTFTLIKKDQNYFLSENAKQAEITVTVACVDGEPPAAITGAVRLYAVNDTGEEITLGVGECEAGTAVIVPDDIILQKGEYSVYAAYMGGQSYEIHNDGTGTLHLFKPSNTEPVTITVGDLSDMDDLSQILPPVIGDNKEDTEDEAGDPSDMDDDSQDSQTLPPVIGDNKDEIEDEAGDPSDMNDDAQTLPPVIGDNKEESAGETENQPTDKKDNAEEDASDVENVNGTPEEKPVSTGDENNMAVYLGLFLMAIAALGAMIAIERKTNR